MDSKYVSNKVSAMQILDRLDKGLIPDEELRKLVLIQFKRRLKWGYKPTYAQQLEFNLNFITLYHTLNNEYTSTLLPFLLINLFETSFYIHAALKQMKMSGTMDVINSESYDFPAAFLEAMFGQTQTEDMKHVGLFLRKISKWMTEDGLLFLDYICHKTFGHHFEAIDEEDWYSNYIFPKGSVTVPGASTLLYFQDDVAVVDQWVENGKHMARTVEEWLHKLDKNIDAARKILEPCLGSKAAVDKVITHSRTFCIGAYEQFSFNDGEEYMITHILFRKKK
ncbi:hypothetical protein IFM89_032123 [Coptis chinensis]|uniref:Uncharacterized protein n=1 Tax=Coptis chinensis TaxID=261450 RepID=A0A835IVX8_9MAGN|nr:hypothetical protein IFM89_032123 [Coptis chinensis]